MINRISIQQNNRKSIQFEGLKENLRLGEKVLKEFKKEFPAIRSNTYIKAKLLQNEGKKINFSEKLTSIMNKYSLNINEVRKQFDYKRYYTLNQYINDLKIALRTIKHANCGEQADIIQYELLQKGKEAHRIWMKSKTTNKDGCNIFCDHVFTVFDLKKGARVESPKTWGQNAVVVDPWANIVLPAHKAVEYFKSFLGIKEDEKLLVYNLCDRIDVKETVKKMKV